MKLYNELNNHQPELFIFSLLYFQFTEISSFSFAFKYNCKKKLNFSQSYVKKFQNMNILLSEHHSINSRTYFLQQKTLILHFCQ